jgi:hypothetical protein
MRMGPLQTGVLRDLYQSPRQRALTGCGLRCAVPALLGSAGSMPRTTGW